MSGKRRNRRLSSDEIKRRIELFDSLFVNPISSREGDYLQLPGSRHIQISYNGLPCLDVRYASLVITSGAWQKCIYDEEVVLLGPEKPKAEEGTVIPGLSPPPITLTARQAAVIEGLARSKSKEYRLVQRANMIIEMAAGKNNEEVARRTNSNRLSVRLWRRRWLEATQRLELAEKQGVEEQLLTNIIEDILSDKYRSGTPPRFTTEQIAQIVAISCEKPEDSQRPISHWTPRELAEEAIKRQIVESISTRSAGRFLKGDGTTAASSRVLVNLSIELKGWVAIVSKVYRM